MADIYDITDGRPQSGGVAMQSNAGTNPSSGVGSGTNQQNKSAPVGKWTGKTLSHFRLVSMLGKGGMGVVIRAEDNLLKRLVALKVLPAIPLGAPDADRQKKRIEQFLREARSAAKLEHPGVVQIYEVGEANGYYYIAMELVEGGNLEELVKAGGPMDQFRACQIIAEAAEALAYAHLMGIVHRDIKPANLMLTRGGRCKVTDFGLARIDDGSDLFTFYEGVVGTPVYIAPEVSLGQAATPQSDVYCLGATLWYLLVGLPPFNGKNGRETMAMHVKAPLPNLRKFRKDLPEVLVRAIERSLAKRPEDRFDNADTFAKILRGFTIPVNSSSSMAPITSVDLGAVSGGSKIAALWQWLTASKWRIGTAVAILLIALGATLYFAMGSGGGPANGDQYAAAQTAALEKLGNAGWQVPVVVAGTVHSVEVAPNGDVMFLKFEGCDQQTGFRVQYHSQLYAPMAKRFGGSNGSGIIGKKIEVRGVVLKLPGNPPEIALKDVEQIRIADQ